MAGLGNYIYNSCCFLKEIKSKGTAIGIICAPCKDISCAGVQSVTLLNLGASIAIMVNDPFSLAEMVRSQGHSADCVLIQDSFLADISTTELYFCSMEAGL